MSCRPSTREPVTSQVDSLGYIAHVYDDVHPYSAQHSHEQAPLKGYWPQVLTSPAFYTEAGDSQASVHPLSPGIHSGTRNDCQLNERSGVEPTEREANGIQRTTQTRFIVQLRPRMALRLRLTNRSPRLQPTCKTNLVTSRYSESERQGYGSRASEGAEQAAILQLAGQWR